MPYSRPRYFLLVTLATERLVCLCRYCVPIKTTTLAAVVVTGPRSLCWRSCACPHISFLFPCVRNRSGPTPWGRNGAPCARNECPQRNLGGEWPSPLPSAALLPLRGARRAAASLVRPSAAASPRWPWQAKRSGLPTFAAASPRWQAKRRGLPTLAGQAQRPPRVGRPSAAASPR